MEDPLIEERCTDIENVLKQIGKNKTSESNIMNNIISKNAHYIHILYGIFEIHAVYHELIIDDYQDYNISITTNEKIITISGRDITYDDYENLISGNKEKAISAIQEIITNFENRTIALKHIIECDKNSLHIQMK